MKKSIGKLIENNHKITKKKPGFPNIGKRQDKREFSDAVRKIEEAWYFYDTDLYKFSSDENIIKLGSGNPIDYKPFPLPIKKLRRDSFNNLYQYPPAAGDEKSREKIVDYLISEGFPKQLTIDNVIVTCSTTQAFYLILKSLFRPYDCIIMTAPNYGLFTFMPERMNMTVEVIELKQKNDYIINPNELDNAIIQINKKLKKKYEGKLEYIPCVRAFLNINPHNPLGNVLSSDDIDILKDISKICDKYGVFVIDDLIYRDLVYDRNKIALPVATLNEYFDNSISLFGLSKSYGMASTRSGFIVANEIVIRLIRDNMFYVMDSSPYLQSLLLAETYNTSKKRKKYYNMYFKKVINKYKFNCFLTIAMFNGIESISDSGYYKKILKFLTNKIKNKDYLKFVLEGIPTSEIKIVPQSGYFMLIDFTKIKNYSNIKSEKELLKYFYNKCGIKFLVGQSFSWPNTNELIIRLTYSFDKKVLLDAFLKMNIAIRELIKNEANRSNSKSE